MGLLEGIHLRLRVRLQELFVLVRVVGRVGVGGGAVAGRAGLRGGTEGGEDGGVRVARVVGARPAVAPVDVVEEAGAVGVGLGPFAADGGTPAR